MLGVEGKYFTSGNCYRQTWISEPSQRAWLCQVRILKICFSLFWRYS